MRFGLFLLIFSLPAMALFNPREQSSCTSVDLRETVYANKPPNHQGALGNCYAHTAQAILDAERYYNQDPNFQHTISVRDLGIGASLVANEYDYDGGRLPHVDNDYSGGTAFMAYNYAKAHGVCHSDELFNDIGEDQFLVFLDQWRNELVHSLGSDGDMNLAETITDSLFGSSTKGNRLRSTQERVRSEMTHFLGCSTQLRGEILGEAVENLLDTFTSDQWLEFARDSLLALCEHHPIDIGRIEEDLILSSPNERGVALGRMHLALMQRNPKPVSIIYCAKVLSDYSYSPRRHPSGNPASLDCSSHVSAVIGRRWNEDSQTCQFLIRNSYGSACMTRLNKQQFSQEEREVNPTYSNFWDCEDGNVWINEEAIYNNISGYSYIP